jgi:hypothetical protein
MIEITEDEWRALRTYLNEMKLAGYIVLDWTRGTQSVLSAPISRWDKQKYYRIASIRQSAHYATRSLNVAFNIKATERPWRVTAFPSTVRTAYKHLDMALDRVSAWVREWMPLDTSGIGDGA